MVFPGLLANLRKTSFPKLTPLLVAASLLIISLVLLATYQIFSLNKSVNGLSQQKKDLASSLLKTQKELADLKNQDQYKKNKELEDRIKNIETTYLNAVKAYENISDLNPTGKTASDLNTQLAKALSFLAKQNYASAAGVLADLNTKIDGLTASAANQPSTANLTASNSPPGSGYQRQVVHSDIGDYVVDIITANLNSARVIVDTASDSTCKDNCPVLPLATYAARSGAFAGVNGSYFCPASYPSCAGKTNSFDTLLMNKNKVYFNSDNNVYSTVPAVIFGSGWVRFVGRSLDWGRDTGIDSMIANQPLLLSGGNIVFGGNSDPKEGAKGNRGFVGANGNTVYIGVTHNVTVAEMAHILKAMGMTDALNLDDGGSTALWFGGYKVGPGRDLPNVILFVRK